VLAVVERLRFSFVLAAVAALTVRRSRLERNRLLSVQMSHLVHAVKVGANGVAATRLPIPLAHSTPSKQLDHLVAVLLT
jgi:hypothetical protein